MVEKIQYVVDSCLALDILLILKLFTSIHWFISICCNAYRYLLKLWDIYLQIKCMQPYYTTVRYKNKLNLILD
jgi:hypothetical protein